MSDEAAKVKRCERAAVAVGGRPRTSWDGSPAGFEIDREFLSALVVIRVEGRNTPSDTPRHKLLRMLATLPKPPRVVQLTLASEFPR